MDVETRIGTAGWSLPVSVRERFPGAGTHLERYAAAFSCVEINSTFYRPHRRSTFERWAASVPPDFRFALKIPKTITHERRLIDTGADIEAFLASTAGLGAKRDVLLVQLPPSLAYDPSAAPFFTLLRAGYAGRVACEPRHPSWFGRDAEEMLAALQVARVAADPAVAPGAGRPGGWHGLHYRRLHGSPRIYWSAYEPAFLDALTAEIAGDDRPNWCIFDNTAAGAATGDALAVTAQLASVASEGARRRA